MSRWFRMYGELLDDPKVQRLSGDDFKGWVNLLCLASRNEGKLPNAKDIAFALRLDDRKCAAMVQRLIAAGLIDEAGNGYEPHAWAERQYKSDVSTDRVKRFRNAKKAVARNGDETFHETAPDTETDTDVPLSKDNGVVVDFPKPAEVDPDKAFWDGAKAYLGPGKASLIGKWVSQHGREATAAAISAAQVNRAVDPVQYIQGSFRKQAVEAQPMVPL